MLVAVDAPLGPELGHKELEDVLWDALHHGADLLEVDSQRLLGSHVRELLGLHCGPLLLDEVGALCVEDAQDAVRYVLSGLVGLMVVRDALLVVGGFELGDDPPLIRETNVMYMKPPQRPGGVKAGKVMRCRSGR